MVRSDEDGRSARTYVAYYRVSTSKQGEAGLGLEAQRAAARVFCAQDAAIILSEHVEVESGRKANRPNLAKAVNEAKRKGATLLIAKLDRLARNVHFVSGLMESGVLFLALDMPSADRFMIHVYAAMAEEEARRISSRTKAALAVAKARGVRLGVNALTLAITHRAEADAFASLVAPKILAMADQGNSIRLIAKKLNSESINTAMGGRWHATTVYGYADSVKQARFEANAQR